MRARSLPPAKGVTRPRSKRTSAKSASTASSCVTGASAGQAGASRHRAVRHPRSLKDPPFSRVDLISCRNVLIYLDRELQEQVCSTFQYALKPGRLPVARLVRDRRQSSRIVPRPSTGTPASINRPRYERTSTRPLLRLLGPVRAREQVRSTRPHAHACGGAERGDASSSGDREAGSSQHPGGRERTA